MNEDKDKCKQCGKPIEKRYRRWQLFCCVVCRNLWHKANTVHMTREEYNKLKGEQNASKL